MSKEITQKRRVAEGKANQVEEEIQVEEEDIPVNVVTTADGWDIFLTCVGNPEGEQKDRDRPEMEEEVEDIQVIGLVPPFLV